MKIIRYILIVFLTAAAVFSALKFRAITREGMDHQELEESIAVTYIKDRMNGDPGETVYEEVETETVVTESYATPRDELEYSDDVYPYFFGRHYTPDYATGTIMGVLEIPSIELRRGIYTGTWEDIAHDLEAWMTVQARPDYELGETHFCIYGHNAVSQELSFNKLRYVQIGEYFIITSGDKVYYYEVTDFFANWRESVTRDIVDNFDISKDKCYIITCGRDEYRWRDIVLVGDLKEVYTLEEWEKGEIHYYEVLKNDYKKIGVRNEKEKALLQISASEGQLDVTVTDESGSPLSDISIGIYDQDGFLVKDEEGSEMSFMSDENGQIRAEIAPGQYVVGIESDVYYTSDYDVQITEKKLKTEEAKKELYLEDIPSWAIYSIIAAIWLLLCIVIILFTRKPKEEIIHEV